jgi:hypothetical protein
MEETDGYDTPSLTRDLDLCSQPEPMNIRPEFDPETTDPDLGHHQNQPGADQDNEEVFYDCRSQSTEEIEECGVGVGTPFPEDTQEEPRELVWGLSKDEWATVMVEGITPLEGNTIELWDDRDLASDCEIRVYFDVPLVFLELNIQKVSKGLYHLIPPCTLSVISVRYIVLAENVHSGKLVWERDPGPKDLDNRFYFQSQLPPRQRANPSAQSRGSASASRHEVLKPTSILDEDWEGAYEIQTLGGQLWNRLLSPSMQIQIPKAGPRASD